jgi:hypothetical protein
MGEDIYAVLRQETMRQLGFLSNVPINDLVTCPDIDWLEIPLQSMNLVTESDTMLAPLKRTLVLKWRLVEGKGKILSLRSVATT